MPTPRGAIRVVIDTNVFVANFLSHSPRSPNRRVVRLWMVERRIRLAVSREILDEYLQIFAEVLGFNNEKLDKWRLRFGDKKSARQWSPAPNHSSVVTQTTICSSQPHCPRRQSF